jgi:hypothetical protein
MAGQGGDVSSGGDDTPYVAPDWTNGLTWQGQDGEAVGPGGQWQYNGATAGDPGQVAGAVMDQGAYDYLKKMGWNGGQTGMFTQTPGTEYGGGGTTNFSPEFHSFLTSHGITPRAYDQGDANNPDLEPGTRLDWNNANGTTGYSSKQQGSAADPVFNGLIMAGIGALGGAAFSGLGGVGEMGSGFDAGGNFIGNGAGAADAAISGTSGSSTLGSALTRAGQSAATSGGTTAMQGGKLGDIFKNAAIGGATSGIGSGVNYFNPADAVGIPSDYQGYANNALSRGTSSFLTGGNPTQTLVGSAMGAAGKYVGNTMSDTSGDYPDISGQTPTMPTPEQQQGMGNLFASNPDALSGPAYAQQKNPGQPDQSENPIMANIKSTIASFSNPSPGGLNFANMGSNLLDMYNRNRQMQGNQRMADNLSGMYGPNSAYAQQMRSDMMRAQAGSGRRSDVGGLNVALQAKLADANSRNAPLLNTLQNQQGTQRNAMLSDIYRLGAGGPNGGGLGGALMNRFMPQPQPAPYLNYGNPVSQAPTTSTNEDWSPGG